jgi:hypothetical protein
MRRVALRVLLSVVVVFLFAPTVFAQKDKNEKKASSGASTTGNSSWEQAIAALQAQVDQQAQMIAQLQTALASEATARQQGDAATLAAAKQYPDAAIAVEAAARQQGDVNTLASANAYTDTAFSTEAAAREAADVTLQNNITTLAQSGGDVGGSNTGTVPQQLLDLAPYLSVDMHTVNGVPGPNVILTGVNLHIRNGQPAQYSSWPTFGTASYSANGRGNLIVGYNDDAGQNDITPYRTGSHNIIVGDLHRFVGNGTFLNGWANTAEANASAVGGYGNGVSGWAATVAGGHANFAVVDYSHVSGGDSNVAEGVAASVTGGLQNDAVANYSTISGGHLNLTTGFNSSVTGGENNWAKGASSTVSGGLNQSAEGDYSTAP